MAASKVTITNDLKIVAGFTDGDDRLITLPNPKPNLTEQQIRAIESSFGAAFVGDKTGAQFDKFKSAAYVQSQTTEYDLTSE